jgi:hypothetical protein
LITFLSEDPLEVYRGGSAVATSTQKGVKTVTVIPATTGEGGFVDVIRLDREGHRELVSMRWGLVP